MKKNESQPSAFRRLLLDSRKFWPGVAGILLFDLLGGSMQVLLASIWGKIVDESAAGSGRLPALCFGMMGVILVLALRKVFNYQIVAVTSEKMFAAVRKRIFHALTEGRAGVLSASFQSGDLLIRLVGEMDELCELVAGKFTGYLSILINAVISVVICLVWSPVLAILYLLLIPFSVWLMKRISGKIGPLKKQASQQNAAAFSIASDAFAGIETVKSFQMEEKMASRFGEAIDRSSAAQLEVEKRSSVMLCIRYLTVVLQLLLFALVGIFLIRGGMITVGTLFAFLSLTGNIRTGFERVDKLLRDLQIAETLSRRLYEILDTPPETESGRQMPDAPDTENPIVLRQVSFGYGDRPVLQNLSLAIRKNETVGIIGMSGSGKSTLLRLFGMLEQPTGGEMLFNGVSSADWPPNDWRRNLALVSQHPFLFTGTIRENLRYGRPEATEEEMIRALRQAQLWEHVCSLPDGLDSDIGEWGKNLSGGQQQKLTIARALLKKAPVLLLDEITSALDNESEQEIIRTVQALSGSHTLIIVTHRLGIVQHADRILCLEDGQIAEEGSPARLLQEDGYYTQMMRLQGFIQ